ncbi:MAG: hypothetical protein INQ03_13335 [Candidatus Heimdallarchaeota archaeon]|nr:hypothetical protein [Candidatus Heimdallarchaeota archaeon]
MENIKSTLTEHRRVIWMMIKVIALFWLTLHVRMEAQEQMFVNGGQDVDEPIYVEAGERYALMIQEGNISAIIHDEFNQEHPILTKLLFGFASLMVEDTNTTSMDAARMVSAIFAALVSVAIVIEFGILPALLWTYSVWAIKYSSEAYLEATSTAFTIFSLVAIIWVNRYYKEGGRKYYLWLVLSALLSAAAFSSKYTGILVGIIVFGGLTLILRDGKINDRTVYNALKDQLIWIVSFLITFIIFNPRALLVSNFRDSLFYHVNYSQSEGVLNENTFAQFLWIFGNNNPLNWHQNLEYPYLDPYILLISFLGCGFLLYRLFIAKEDEKFKISIVLGYYLLYTIFLLAWSTKWPQYLVIYIMIASIAASYPIDIGLQTIMIALKNGVLRLSKSKVKQNLGNIPISLLFSTFILLILILSYAVLTPDPVLNTGDDPFVDTPVIEDTGNFTLTWNTMTHSISEDTGEWINDTYIWNDPVGDDSGSGSYTYPTHEYFSNEDAADIEEMQVRIAGGYLILSIKMVNLYDVGWGSSIGNELAAIFVAIDTGESSGVDYIEQTETSFDHDYELLVSIMFDIWVGYQSSSGWVDKQLEQDKYNVIQEEGWIQIALNRTVYGLESNSLNLYVMAALEELAATREVIETAEEWRGGGATASDSDFYDLALLTIANQQAAISSGTISATSLDLSSLELFILVIIDLSRKN